MEPDESENGPEDELEENAVHEPRAELDRPMGESELSYIDRRCFDALSAMFRKVSWT